MIAPPTVRISAPLRALLIRTERSLARLDGALATLPDARPMVELCLRREAASSSTLAGAPVSPEELLAEEAGVGGTGTPSRGVAEGLRHLSAFREGVATAETGRITARSIRALHGHLLGEGRSGAEASRPLREIERFLGARDDLPDLLRVGLLHARVLALRPFPAGTGRVARLLVPLVLMERGVVRAPVLHFSGQLRRHRRRYHALLHGARAGGDQEAWLTFFLEQLDEAGREAADDARRFLLLLEDSRGRMVQGLGRVATNGLQVLSHLLLRPIVSVHDVQEVTGTTYAAANNLVSRLVELGVLVEVTGNARNRRFRFEPLVRLFSGDPVW